MLVDLSDLNSENSEGSGSGGIQVRNKLTLNDKNIMYLRSNMWIQFVRCRFHQTYIFTLNA